MPRVLICDKLEAAGLDILTRAGIDLDNRPGLKGLELAAALRAADGAVVRSGTRLTADLLDDPGKLRASSGRGVGVDNIDVPAATRRGVIVMNTPSGNTVSAAEHTIALLLALAAARPGGRRVDEGRQVGPQQVPRHPGRRQDARRHRPGPHRPRGRPPGRRPGHGGHRLRPARHPGEGGRVRHQGRRKPRRAAAEVRLPHPPHPAVAGYARTSSPPASWPCCRRGRAS